MSCDYPEPAVLECCQVWSWVVKGIRMTPPPGIFARARGVVKPNYAVMPPEGILASYIPGFQGTTFRIQAAPQLGARFAQMLMEIDAGGGTTTTRDDGLEHVFYVVSGTVRITIDGTDHDLTTDGYAYVPTGTPYALVANEESRVIWIKRPYEKIDLPVPAPIVGRRDLLEKYEVPDEPGRYWLRLLPTEDLAFDMHVNILAFEPGVYFPYVETHIMEHGLYMLEGQMAYMLGGDLHEVEKGDFIWMGAFCPQFCIASGREPSAYLLYKDVNRDITF
jgi:(S)-ureidoglycine aminohydrolase